MMHITWKTLLACGFPNTQRDDTRYAPLLIQSGIDKKAVVMVERVLHGRELIVNTLGDYASQLRGVVGASILGDGSTITILDLNDLILSYLESDSERGIIQDFIADITEDEDSYVLVVDDSLSARRSLTQFVTEIGLSVKSAKDGVEALQLIHEVPPIIVLADLEMPRMNGIELTSNIRASSDTKDIPVIMITSRSTDRHIKLADNAGVSEYLTKPYSESKLLDVIQQHTD